VSEHEAPANCLNCDAELQGKYCHACGQKATGAALSVHDFTHEATHEFLHLDGKIWQTVKLLVLKPGELTREFLAGRRARYISPVRVYLTCSILFFTLAAILPRTMDGAVQIKKTGGRELTGDTDLERRLKSGLARTEKNPELLGKAVLENLPKVMFVLMPIFGLLTWMFYRRQQRFYIAHLYYAIHFHAFAFLMMSVYVTLSRIGVPKVLAVLVLLTTIPWHFIALRRVFGGTRAMTFVKGLAVAVTYWLVAMTAVLIVAFAILVNL
jgi:hypothetical protein